MLRSGLFWRSLTMCAVVWLATVGVLTALYQTYGNRLWLLGVSAAIIGLAAFFVAYWLTRRVAYPLQELTQAADRIALGKFDLKIYAAQRGEIGELARAFNLMSERLGQQFAQMEEDRHQLRTVLSGMVEGVVALDAGQRILFANERAAQLLDFQSQFAVGRKLWEVVRLRALQDVVRRALAGPDPAQEELTVSGATERSLTVHAARLPGAAARGAVLVLHDTSDLRRLERVRQEFVTNVSHELKTPLSVIMACVETLLDGAAEDPVHRGPFLERIAEQGERLHTLILDLLSLARIESGTEVFELQSIPVEAAVTQCLERHRARAEGKHQVLEAIPPAEERGSVEAWERESAGEAISPTGALTLPRSHALTSSQVWADEEALSEILDNLVDNALKYTPERGRITVRWRMDGKQICLEVEDTGIGIPEPDLARVFERFYRVDKARSRELGGTGLGLSIVKHLVQAMNGSIVASSQPGKGSVFSVRLPLAPAV